MKRTFFIFCLIVFVSPLLAQTISVKPDEALKLIFSDSQQVVSEDRTLTPSQKETVEKRLGSKLSKDIWKFFIAKSGARIDGYALIDHEVGKTEPITFLTAISPEGTVRQVEILVYREPIGSEVEHSRFRNQYRGKSAEDPIRVGQDIANISGATLSARAVTVGVKRAVTLWKVLYGHS